VQPLFGDKFLLERSDTELFLAAGATAAAMVGAAYTGGLVAAHAGGGFLGAAAGGAAEGAAEYVLSNSMIHFISDGKAGEMSLQGLATASTLGGVFGGLGSFLPFAKGPKGVGNQADEVVRITPTPETPANLPMQRSSSSPVYRVQEPDLPLLPHESPFWDPSRYGYMGENAYSKHALYFSFDEAELAAKRAGQGYFEAGCVMCKTTLGELLDAAESAGYTNLEVIYDSAFNGGATVGSHILLGNPPAF
jgi:hypothetical protein